MLMSLATHTALLLAIGMLWNQLTDGGGSTEIDRPVGIALAERLPDRNQYTEPAETDDQTMLDADRAMTRDVAPPSEFSAPLDLDGVLESMQTPADNESAPVLAGEVNLGRDAFAGSGAAEASTSDSKTTASVFGISGSGTRFVYVFDRSDSMNGFGGRPLRAAKAELIRSLTSLDDRQHFQIIFYNNQPAPFRTGGTPLRMVPGERGYLNEAERFVRSISAFGGTSHHDALRMALRFAPDVVFFLTDARVPRLSQRELLEIKHRADDVGTVIHAIEFGDQPLAPASSFLRELAGMNRGQYQYINIRRLTERAR